MTTAILGAGMAGIMLGKLLKERGESVQLIEKEQTAGGLCRTEVIDGFVFDMGGGHIIHSAMSQVLDLMLDTVGLDNLVKHRRNTKILINGVYVQYPFENGLYDLPPQLRFECVRDYILAYFARQNGKLPPPQNFADWIHYRFGHAICQIFMGPYNDKIWNIDLRELGVDWVAGRVPDAPFDDVLKSAMGIRTEGYAHQATFYYPLRGGFQTLVDALAREIEENLVAGEPVQSLERRRDGWLVNGTRFERVISTIPLPELVTALDGAPDAIRQAAQRIRINSVVTFLFGLDYPQTSDLSWVYLPHREQGPANRITYLSGYSPNNAPPGKSSLMAEVTFPPGPQPNINKEFANDLAGHLHDIGMLRKEAIVLTQWRFNKYAYPVTDLTFRRKVDAVLAYLDGVGIQTFGRFGRCEYLNVDHVIARALEFVESKKDSLATDKH